MPEPQILLSGLAIGESPRWHEGRLWFSNWGTQEIVAVDLQGNSEVMARVPTTIPFSIPTRAVFPHNWSPARPDIGRTDAAGGNIKEEHR